jgi:hypothetical protein
MRHDAPCLFILKKHRLADFSAVFHELSSQPWLPEQKKRPMPPSGAWAVITVSAGGKRRA